MRRTLSFVRARAAIVVLALLAGCVPLCKAKRAPDIRYELPAGYHGWAWIEWDVPDAPALETDKDELVVKVPAGGYARTSTRFGSGVRITRWMFPDSSKAEPLARQFDHTQKDFNGRPRVLESVFIGPGPATPRPPAPAP